MPNKHKIIKNGNIKSKYNKKIKIGSQYVEKTCQYTIDSYWNICFGLTSKMSSTEQKPIFY